MNHSAEEAASRREARQMVLTAKPPPTIPGLTYRSGPVFLFTLHTAVLQRQNTTSPLQLVQLSSSQELLRAASSPIFVPNQLQMKRERKAEQLQL